MNSPSYTPSFPFVPAGRTDFLFWKDRREPHTLFLSLCLSPFSRYLYILLPLFLSLRRPFIVSLVGRSVLRSCRPGDCPDSPRLSIRHGRLYFSMLLAEFLPQQRGKSASARAEVTADRSPYREREREIRMQSKRERWTERREAVENASKLLFPLAFAGEAIRGNADISILFRALSRFPRSDAAKVDPGPTEFSLVYDRL